VSGLDGFGAEAGLPQFAGKRTRDRNKVVRVALEKSFMFLPRKIRNMANGPSVSR